MCGQPGRLYPEHGMSAPNRNAKGERGGVHLRGKEVWPRGADREDAKRDHGRIDIIPFLCKGRLEKDISERPFLNDWHFKELFLLCICAVEISLSSHQIQ